MMSKGVIFMDEIKYQNLILSLDEERNFYTIIGCNNDSSEVIVPKRINDICIKKIDEYAFSDCEKLTKVIFPEYNDLEFANGNCIQEIGEYAFSNCKLLEEINIPNTVLTIDRGAFSRCSSLKKCFFNSNAFVGPYAFYECVLLEEVSMVSNVSEGVFSSCQSLPYFPVNDSVDYISEEAFENCYKLENIKISFQVKVIEKLAFRGCMLKSVIFERRSGWYWHNRYTDLNYPLDVNDPVENAQFLSNMDFDDGIEDIFVK